MWRLVSSGNGSSFSFSRCARWALDLGQEQQRNSGRSFSPMLAVSRLHEAILSSRSADRGGANALRIFPDLAAMVFWAILS
jgi:hypothetical protein